MQSCNAPFARASIALAVKQICSRGCALACRLQINAFSCSGCCAVLCISGASRGCRVRFQTSKAFASTCSRSYVAAAPGFVCDAGFVCTAGCLDVEVYGRSAVHFDDVLYQVTLCLCYGTKQTWTEKLPSAATLPESSAIYLR